MSRAIQLKAGAIALAGNQGGISSLRIDSLAA